MAKTRVGVRPRPTPLVPTSLGFNYGYEFDGVDENISIPSSLNLNTSDAFSISYWFKRPIATSWSQNVFNETDFTNGYAGLSTGANSGYPNMYIQAQDGKRVWIRSAVNLTVANVWNHVLWVKNTGQDWTDFKLYINGVLTTTNRSPLFYNNLNAGVDIGDNEITIGGNASAKRFQGRVDDIQFYNFELNATQVSDIYNNGYVTAPTLGPIHHWKLGEDDTFSTNWTVNDSVGSLNGTSVNMEEEDRKLGVDYSMKFDGVDEYISFGNHNISGAFSVMAWFKTTGTGLENIIADWASGVRSWQLRLNSGKVEVFTSPNGSGFNSFKSPLSYNDGNWHQVIFTFGPTGDGILYIDGSSVATSSYNYYVVYNSSTNLEIGRNQFGAQYFDGNIMYTSIFDSELSASDVTSLYNSGVPVDSRDVSLSPTFFVPLGGENDSFSTNWTFVDEINGNNGTSVNMEEADKTSETP